jgi:hypothetical protein
MADNSAPFAFQGSSDLVQKGCELREYKAFLIMRDVAQELDKLFNLGRRPNVSLRSLYARARAWSEIHLKRPLNNVRDGKLATVLERA